MKDELVCFETAKLAKEKGFDESCNFVFEKNNNEYTEKYLGTIQRKNSTYEHVITRMAQSLLQKWLRENHDTHIVLPVDPYSQDIELYSVKVYKDSNGMCCVFTNEVNSKRLKYEDALEIGLQEALKLI